MRPLTQKHHDEKVGKFKEEGHRMDFGFLCGNAGSRTVGGVPLTDRLEAAVCH